MRIVRADSLTDADRDEMVQALTAAFGRWPSFELPGSPSDHLRWKLENPYDEHPGYVTLCRRDGRLVALSTSPFRPFLLHGKSAVGMGGGDAATIPDAQGQGLYSSRRRFQNEHMDPRFDLQIWFSQNPTVLEHSRSTSNEFPLGNRIIVRTRVLDAHRLAADRASRGRSRMPARLLEAALLAPQAIARVAERTLPHVSGLRIEQVDRFDERVDEFFMQASRPYDAIAIRDAPLLNWRYCDERGGRYLPLVAFEGEAIAGYAVLKLTPDRAFLADLLALPGREDVVIVLLQKIVEVARREGAMAVAAWLPAVHPYTDVYKRMGFFDSRYETGATVNDWGKAGSGALDFLRDPEARVHLAMGDSDWV